MKENLMNLVCVVKLCSTNGVITAQNFYWLACTTEEKLYQWSHYKKLSEKGDKTITSFTEF